MQHPHAVTRDEEPEAGFTLIELMMVVLIIAILIAVLIPTFVGAKQTGARPSDAVEPAQRADCGEGRLQRSRGLHGSDGGRARQRRAGTHLRRGGRDRRRDRTSVSVNPVSANYIVMAGQSRSGTCFFVSDDESAAGVGVQYAEGSERDVQRERGAGRRRPELGVDLVERRHDRCCEIGACVRNVARHRRRVCTPAYAAPS